MITLLLRGPYHLKQADKTAFICCKCPHVEPKHPEPARRALGILGGRSRHVRTHAGARILPKAPSAGISTQSRGAAWSCLDPERSARGHRGAPAVRPPTPQLANHKRPRCPTRERRRQPRVPHTPGAERGAETSGRGPSAAERALPEAAGGPRPRLGWRGRWWRWRLRLGSCSSRRRWGAARRPRRRDQG